MTQGQVVSGSGSFKRCVRCRKLKPLDAFAWKQKSQAKRVAHCRTCQAAYHRKHYEANRERYIRKAAAITRQKLERRWDLLVGYLSDKQCVDCGEKDLLVLEFDHLGDKLFNVSFGIRNRSWSAVLEEIQKCEVVCANCHRRRTAFRAKQWRSCADHGG